MMDGLHNDGEAQYFKSKGLLLFFHYVSIYVLHSCGVRSQRPVHTFYFVRCFEEILMDFDAIVGGFKVLSLLQAM